MPKKILRASVTKWCQRSTVPQEAATSEPVRYYQEFLNHDELELACDVLEAYAEDCV